MYLLITVIFPMLTYLIYGVPVYAILMTIAIILLRRGRIRNRPLVNSFQLSGIFLLLLIFSPMTTSYFSPENAYEELTSYASTLSIILAMIISFPLTYLIFRIISKRTSKSDSMTQTEESSFTKE